MGAVVIWSATPYCGEADVLEIRLGTLAGVVDRHVLVEADSTQRGNPKPFHFLGQQKRFHAWREQIDYVPVRLGRSEGEHHDWARERNQRDALQGTFTPADDDLVLLADVDEIPHPSFLRDYGEPMRLEMDMHVGFLNWRWPERPVRYGTRATLVSGAQFKAELPSRIVEGSWPLSGWAGWHLAYQADSEGIRRKILNIADDFRRPEFLDLAHIEHCRQTGADLYGRHFRQSEWCPDDELPPYVLQHRERFAHMLIPEPAAVAA